MNRKTRLLIPCMSKSIAPSVPLLALLFALVVDKSARAMNSGTPEYILNAAPAPAAVYSFLPLIKK